jgi:peptidoglycan/xylan/chitin deacetylase (PgdA/CDA1 family)
MPKIIRPIAKDLVWTIPRELPTLFITFDDGPIPEVTPQVLEILESYNAKATFFCVGHNVEKHPAVYQLILDKGHSIGNHSYNHLSGWKTNTNDYVSNVLKANKLIDSKLFRPPYGKITRAQMKVLKEEYKIIMWDVLSGDFDSKTSIKTSTENVIKNARSGSIIVFHDSLKAASTMLASLPIILKHFSELGFQFNAISMH